jgi:hypothetical protein
MKTETRRAALGQAKLALRFQIPSQASSHGIVKSPSPILLRKWSCFALESSFGKNRVALGFQAGMCCEKASASPLASVFSKQIQHSRGESTP